MVNRRLSALCFLHRPSPHQEMRPRSPAVEELREFCNARNSERTFRLFEVYDLEGHEKISYEATGKGLRDRRD
jgi:hypothetical protein